jgi:hypothetical protein
MLNDGTRWFAASNWTSEIEDGIASVRWDLVERAEPQPAVTTLAEWAAARDAQSRSPFLARLDDDADDYKLPESWEMLVFAEGVKIRAQEKARDKASATDVKPEPNTKNVRARQAAGQPVSFLESILARPRGLDEPGISLREQTDRMVAALTPKEREIAASSIGRGLANIRENGIDAELASLKSRSTRKKAPATRKKAPAKGSASRASKPRRKR